MKEKLLYLVDSVDYVKKNCYQSQLLRAMQYSSDLEIVSVYSQNTWFLKSILADPSKYKKVVSVLRLRTLNNLLPILAKWLKNTPLVIYDQDPWESFIDSSPINGAYYRIRDSLNVSKFYVTAPFWSKYMNDRNLNASWVKMGVDPILCDEGPNFLDREIEIGFRGAMHNHRAIKFNELKKLGLNITIGEGRLNYPNYMKYLHTLKFFAHDESLEPLICENKTINRSNAMWIKTIETASRGTFVLRNWHREGLAYDIDKISTILTYKTTAEIPELLDTIKSIHKDDLKSMQFQSVKFIRESFNWIYAANSLLNIKN